ncbi:sialidase family protein [Lysinibacillus sp. FSL P4-0201]|uniref:sialidase family protein n=1 Tax=Lysinibacillus sp. FSL P4-0201 TaxID=2921721 RepID=UPI00315A486A
MAAQYYYDKFNTITNYTYSQGPWSSEAGWTPMTFWDLYRNYTFYSQNGSYGVSNQIGYSVPLNIGDVAYRISGSTLQRFTIYAQNEGNLSGASHNVTIAEKKASEVTSVPSYNKGSLVQSNIVAENGTYPANGRHTDGYWYVRGAEVVGEPGTITTSAITYENTGGRKVTRLSNGWLVMVAANKAVGTVYWYVSKDGGTTWSLLSYNNGGWTAHFAIASYGTTVYTVVSAFNTTGVVKFDATTVSNANQPIITITSTEQTGVNSVSIATDPLNGAIHLLWLAKTTTYPNSWNLRYTKSTNGGSTWNGAANTTQLNASATNYTYIDLVVRNGVPIALSQHYNQSIGTYTIYSHVINSSNGSSVNYEVFAHSLPLGKLSLAVDKNGVLHAVCSVYTSASNSTYNVVYSRSVDGGVVWGGTKYLTNAVFGRHSHDATISVDASNKLVVAVSTSALIQSDGYNDIASFYSSNGGDSWTQGEFVATSSVDNLTVPFVVYDPTFSVTLQNPPATLYIQNISGASNAPRPMFRGTLSINKAPSVTLISPSDNQTLYENDTINLTGDAYDADKDQSVTVFYQINGDQRKVLATNVSQTQITLSKQLTFKNGKLFDGETALTGTLAEGVAHTLKVWAVDNENGQSATIERTFYVVPNRAPLLSVDAVVPAGVVDADKFKISGTSSDPDANANVKVTKKVNANNPVEIYNGPGGPWEFDVSLAELVVGENTIVIEVIDNYGAKTSKTIKLKKNEVKTPILHAVARYKITPPAGSAKGVLLFIERDEGMDLKVELSMTLAGEQEQYETLTANNTAPMPTKGIVEDTFYFETTEPKDNIILKISTTRSDVMVNHKIHLISGAVE